MARIVIRTGDDLLKSGKRPDALRRYESALGIFHSLSASPDSMYSREIAVTNFRLGDAHAMDGDWMEALAAYRRSLERVQAAAASDPDDALARADLAESYGAVGRALANTGRVEQGLEFLRRGLTLAGAEVARDPKHAELSRVLAFVHLWNGQVLDASGNEKDALDHYRSSVMLFQQLASTDRNDVDAQLCAAAAQLEVGRVLLNQKDLDGAVEALKISLAITDRMAALPSPNQQVFYTMADADSVMGDVFVQKAKQKNIASSEQLECWSKANSWFQQSSAARHRIYNPGKLGPAGFYAGNPRLLTSRLNECSLALGTLKGSNP
jgi:tetratricopeptide (TPR) repeat protein